MNSLIDSMYPGGTLVFGHRGASAYAPMNTLPAFELAASQGADGVELDVRLTQDGHLIVLHDATVDHVTNGTGAIAEMTFEAARRLDAGAWFGAAFAGVRLPTLDEVFEAVGRKLFVNVEIKLESADETGIERQVADCIARHDMKHRVIVSSFNPLVLCRFCSLMPDVAVGYLHEPNSEAMLRPLLGDLVYDAVHPYHEQVDAAYMATARENDWRVNVWTVNDPDRAKALAALGVDAIITDVPDVIRSALR
jgi:glycerophosphoryl diester phosphodiesterase